MIRYIQIDEVSITSVSTKIDSAQGENLNLETFLMN